MSKNEKKRKIKELEKVKNGRWSIRDHNQFVESVAVFGTDFKSIAKVLGRKE